MVGAQVIAVGDDVGVIGVQQPKARDHIVEEVVVAHKGTEGVEGRTLLLAVLIEPEIEEIVVGEDRE